MFAGEDFEAELLSILKGLIRIDTSNPPGNEIRAAEFVKGILENEKIPAKVLASTPTRGSVVGRIKGNGDKAPLLLLAHLDVVPVEAQKWKVDPFAAEMKNDYVWGRGALDIKDLTSMELMALLLAKRAGLKLKRDVILAATADEEAGGTYGVKWLIQNHFDEIKAEYVINEGGLGLNQNGRKVLFCQCAEKGICWIRINIKGEGGHGSLPTRNNPVLLTGEIISRIGKHVFPVLKTPVTEKLIAGLEKLGFLSKGMRAVDVFGSGENLSTGVSTFDKRLNAWIRNTATPTLVKGGTKVNVIPMETELSVDCRVMPGVDPGEIFKAVQALVDSPDVQYEILQNKPGTESTMDTELWKTLESSLHDVDPKAAFLPYLSPGGTDSGFLREKGIICYGFDPAFATWEEWDTVHGIDERISTESLVNGALILFRVLERFCT
ncbi:MAG: M20/M25/M40 family metallo-hydrolase [Candidatus Eisenbacteria bacterium]|nr:M20/M25/M40 family metallo-hydrolase [Candidatus Eisenbacteria bacterium]